MSDLAVTLGFRAGFASRHAAPVELLHAAFSAPAVGFAPADLSARVAAAPARPSGHPQHFSPADRSAKPTEGWDMLDPEPIAPSIEDQLEAARAAGYAEGVAAAMAATSRDGTRDRTLVEEMLGEIGRSGGVDRDRVARQLRQTVTMLVARLVGEIGVSADLLTERIAAAAELLADANESALLRMNPADVPLVEGRLPRAIFAAGDATLARGTFVLESASTIVEDGPELWLEQLAGAIDKVPIPAHDIPPC